MGKLGIVDFRSIISTINAVYKIDFNDYALTSLKRRFEHVLELYSFENIDELNQKLRDDATFFEIFLRDVSVEVTEMFRDPLMWRYLRDEILPKISGGGDRIWIPDCTSGDDVYSLAILLHEAHLLDKVSVIATSISKKNIERIREGCYDLKKIEVNSANYRRIHGLYDYKNYYEIADGKAYMNKNLLENIELRTADVYNDKAPTRVKMIVYRNKFIYFNQQLQSRILQKLFDALVPGGFFVIGIKETIDNTFTDKGLIIENKSENVYKKIVK